MNTLNRCSENNTLGTSAGSMEGSPQGARGGIWLLLGGLALEPALGNEADKPQKCPKDGGGY